MTEPRRDEIVGDNLREARARAGLSLSAAAEATGVSKAMLGQIERGESSPTMATLWKLCRGLQLPLTALIGPSRSDSAPIRPHEGFVDGPAFRTLFPFDPKTGTEVFLHDLAPNWEHRSEPHAPGVVEDIFVIEGAVEIWLGSDWIRVEPDRALRFNADQAHGYRNPLDRRSRFLNTMHYPG
ncbi:helix-turn-helix domain-containing protein [Paracoccus zeaxanthinifaciens]|uniref:helix-turn-helix domain-containing protein n=1 Tax=Paracoccus zeaxanthinifaciens TaxID=187400 RepID=UPI00058B8E60|nr:XRE family transcriptional regulator [Paracoccus zeaxanthinifaciens]